MNCSNLAGSKLSVVIPTCNRSELLLETLQNVKTQSRVPDEIIVVNNGSEPLAGQFDDGVVKVIDVFPFCGASAARNYGAIQAQGEVIAFIDDDDLWEETYLEKTLSAMEDGDLVLARLDQLDEGQVKPWKKIDKEGVSTSVLFRENSGVTGSNIVIRKAVFLALGGFDTTLITGEDKSLVIEAIMKGIRIITLTECQAIHRQHGDGPRLTHSENMALGIAAFLRKYHGEMTFGEKLWNYQKIVSHHYLSGKQAYWPLYMLFRVLVKSKLIK